MVVAVVVVVVIVVVVCIVLGDVCCNDNLSDVIQAEY